jgi:DNA-binding NtrC family response regulator
MSLLLIVEDVAAMRKQYAYDLHRLGGYETVEAAGVDEALALLEAEPVDCVILDLEMPRRDGFEFLRAHAERGLSVPVIVYTGTGDFDRCARAIRLGAFGFVDKAEPMERIVEEVRQALDGRGLRDEIRRLRRDLRDESVLVGDSRAMQQLRDRIQRLAPIPSAVLIQGESGTGKELVARDLHQLSPRAKDPFLPVNCAALPEHLVEDELFGHERGAFTGADRVRRGAFESAGAGTLFLDEIGELPAAAQAKLLRVLENGTFARLGGNREVKAECRVVAATNRDLDAAAAEGAFREDLLFRLNVHVIPVPPLAERASDIPTLSRHFLEIVAARFRIRPVAIEDAALDRLVRHDWRRNNVRELRNMIERLVIAADGAITEEDAESVLGAGADGGAGGGTFRELRAAAERRIVLEALEKNGWHLTNTARELGLADHASLSKIMKRHDLRRGPA